MPISITNRVSAPQPKRLAYLDIAKGLAIVSIVMVHFSTGFIPPKVNVFIGSYMISMFYVVSGWIDAMRPRQLPFREFLRKRWHQLGVPYIAWTLIILAFDMVLWACGYYDTYFIAREIYKSVVLRGIGTLWFLPALFGAELLWWWVRNKRPQLRCAIVAVAIALFMWSYGIMLGPRDTLASSITEAPFRVVLNIAGAWLGVAAGFCFRRYFLMFIQARHRLSVFIIGLLIASVGWYCAMRHPVPELWSFGAPLFAPIGLILIIMPIDNSPLLHWFRYWGRNSMALMVTHYSIMMVLCDIAVRTVCGQPMDGGWIALSLFVVTMALEYFIAEWLSRHYPKIVGVIRSRHDN